MVKGGDDNNGLQTTGRKNLGKTFQDVQTVTIVAPLNQH